MSDENYRATCLAACRPFCYMQSRLSPIAQCSGTHAFLLLTYPRTNVHSMTINLIDRRTISPPEGAVKIPFLPFAGQGYTCNRFVIVSFLCLCQF